MWLRDLITKSFWLKLASLALAVLIWVTVAIAIRNENRELNPHLNAPARVFYVPVLVLNAASDVRECRVRPERVAVTVRGERKTLDQLKEKDIHAVVDLTDIEYAVTMSKGIDVTTPPGVVCTELFPPKVQVVIAPAIKP